MGSPARVFVGIGSNLGDPAARVGEAIRWLAACSELELKRCTELLETEPWGVRDQPPFVNAVAELRTAMDPFDLLALLKTAETELGRTEIPQKWGPRIIDLDILLYGERVINAVDLTVPHVHLLARSFVLRQLLELDPDLIHPVLHLPLCHFLK